MNFAAFYKALDTVVVLFDTAKRLTGEPPPPPETGLAQSLPPPGLAGHLEAGLTNVLVAALKEAFDRDHARLELERSQLDEQRRRAEEAMRLELRRQAADRELGRLRLLAGTALVGWIASVVTLITRLDTASTVSRIVIAAGWLLLLGALAAAFSAQARVGAYVPERDRASGPGRAGAAALWLLIAGLALSAVSLLF